MTYKKMFRTNERLMILKKLHTMYGGGYPSAWMLNIFASLMIVHTEQNL